jgi:glycyl-tRNA synthetase
MTTPAPTLEQIVSLCKRRGFIFQGSEIYGGLAGTWDYGPYGVTLKNNIKNLWWKMFVEGGENIYGVDAAILMQGKAWEASGHTETFVDPLVECSKCAERFREDQLEKKECPRCGGALGPVHRFNLMFETQVGAGADAPVSYLRPETAGGIFVNFKNVLDSLHPKLPFGIAQIGKAFRNEIAPRDFIFRAREFEQMEVEHFTRQAGWEEIFELWRMRMREYFTAVGIAEVSVHELEVPEAERAHYSKRTIDFEFDYPFGRKELSGLAYRTDFDLTQHSQYSKVDLSYFDEETKERFIPHVVEPSFGLDRIVLAVLVSAYREVGEGEEVRVYLKFPATIAPIRAAVFPLLKNKSELVAKAKEVYTALKKSGLPVAFDDNGNIGKRYRRQDEIGTPSCVTVDFETLQSDTVTLRDRDTGEQERVAISELTSKLSF